MKKLGFAMLALVAASAAPLLASPTDAELANAISTFGRGRAAAADLRRISCTSIEQEPTEFACRWQQRSGNRWRSFSGYLAIDGQNWLLIDTPTPGR